MRRAFIALLVASGWPLLQAATSNPRELHGRVVNMETASAVPVPAARVKILSISEQQERVTNSNGEFFLPLPDSLLAGDQVELTIDAVVNGERLLFFQPLDGRVRIPNDPSKDVVVIGLLPKGSRRFLSDEAIEALIRQANDEGQKQAMLAVRSGSVAQFDLDYFLESWGKERGLDPAEVGKRVSAWAESVEGKPTADLEEKALATFAEQNFGDAARLFAEAGEAHLTRLGEEHKEEEEDRAKVVDDFKQSAEADSNGGLYAGALEEYRRAEAVSDRSLYPMEWAGLKLREAITLADLGETQDGPEAVQSLRLAVSECQSALEVFTEKEHPQDWARTEDNLGNV